MIFKSQIKDVEDEDQLKAMAEPTRVKVAMAEILSKKEVVTAHDQAGAKVDLMMNYTTQWLTSTS